MYRGRTPSPKTDPIKRLNDALEASRSSAGTPLPDSHYMGDRPVRYVPGSGSYEIRAWAQRKYGPKLHKPRSRW